MAVEKKIVLASNNPGKVREINAMLSGRDVQIISQSEFNIPEIEETGRTFVENAILKARNASRHTGLPAIADDSGIALDALNGRPGIYSARYAGIYASDQENLDKLVAEVTNLPEDKRQAHFICVMVYLRHYDDPVPIFAEGIWDGIAIIEPRGKNGFGYDPMFYVPTHQCTSAELPPSVKNTISHRALALKSLLQQLDTVRSAYG